MRIFERTTIRPTLRLAMFSLALAAAAQAAEKVPGKANGKMPHPDQAEEQRSKKAALTEEVGRILPQRSQLAVKRQNYIDDYIFGKMERDKIPHTGLASDQEFLRRVYLDLTGRIPASAAVRKFLADESTDKRNKLIDSLVMADRYAFAEDDPFLDRWTYWFSDLFTNNGGELGTQGRNIFYDYLRTALRLNIPYSELVEEMLMAKAMTNWFSGPANFLIRFHVDDATGNQIAHEDTCDEMAIRTARILLGVNLECISCHNGSGHLDQINLWLSKRKREEVWRQAAFFGNLDVFRPPPRRQEFTLVENGKGYDAEAYPIASHHGYDVKADSVVRMKRWKADVAPTFILTGEKPAPNDDLRRALALMITSSPQFAKTIVNLIWAELMGVGIVDPPLDFDLARQDPNNPPQPPWTVQPTHPELLDALARDFQSHYYDLRYLLQLIAKSSAYQLSASFDGQWKNEYARYFARRFVRRLSAEELFDAIAQSTGLMPEIPVAGTDVKVKRVLQTRSPEDLAGGELSEIARFLSSFGQSDRSRSANTVKGDMVQASLLLNSKVVKERVKAKPGSYIEKLLSQEPPLANEQLVEELFLSVLSRYPTAEEKAVATEQVRQYRTPGVEDVLWALVNKLDFIFNY